MQSETILSAYIKYSNKEDDCYESLILTKFRDDYMMNMSIGKRRVKLYYGVAPKIVEALNASDKKDVWYSYIDEVMKKCVTYGERHLYEFVESEYQLMVKKLMRAFKLKF